MSARILTATYTMSAAQFSPCRRYRYRLSRTWDRSRPRMVWLMLNPSTADAEKDDPTIRRCMGFAKREGCGGIEVLNLYALRSTEPKELLVHEDPGGPLNDEVWREVLSGHEGPIVAAWGGFWARVPHAPTVLEGLTALPVKCLGKTKAGDPRHPLYMRGDQPLEDFWA